MPIVVFIVQRLDFFAAFLPVLFFAAERLPPRLDLEADFLALVLVAPLRAALFLDPPDDLRPADFFAAAFLVPLLAALPLLPPDDFEPFFWNLCSSLPCF